MQEFPLLIYAEGTTWLQGEKEIEVCRHNTCIVNRSDQIGIQIAYTLGFGRSVSHSKNGRGGYLVDARRRRTGEGPEDGSLGTWRTAVAVAVAAVPRPPVVATRVDTESALEGRHGTLESVCGGNGRTVEQKAGRRPAGQRPKGQAGAVQLCKAFLLGRRGRLYMG
jgi:hypothetical protein